MKQLLILICFAFFLISCNRHKCVNKNPVFNQFSPEDKEYKAELLRQLRLRNPAGIHYYVDMYTERAGKPFMTILIQSDSLCARGALDIKNVNKLKKYKNVKGLTYTGAELKGLQYYIDSSNGNYNFVFEEGEIVK